jgi:hypothetical protein
MHNPFFLLIMHLPQVSSVIVSCADRNVQYLKDVVGISMPLVIQVKEIKMLGGEGQSVLGEKDPVDVNAPNTAIRTRLSTLTHFELVQLLVNSQFPGETFLPDCLGDLHAAVGDVFGQGYVRF